MITKAYAYQYRVLCNTFWIILKAYIDTISRIKDILGSIIFSGQKIKLHNFWVYRFNALKETIAGARQ